MAHKEFTEAFVGNQPANEIVDDRRNCVVSAEPNVKRLLLLGTAGHVANRAIQRNINSSIGQRRSRDDRQQTESKCNSLDHCSLSFSTCGCWFSLAQRQSDQDLEAPAALIVFKNSIPNDY